MFRLRKAFKRKLMLPKYAREELTISKRMTHR